jgi:hypothetical protein
MKVLAVILVAVGVLLLLMTGGKNQGDGGTISTPFPGWTKGMRAG